MQTGDKRLLNTLAACLRIADHLERPRTRRIRDVEIEINDETVVLKPVSSGNPTLELWGMNEHEAIFETAFNRRLVIDTEFSNYDESDNPLSVTEL